MVAVHGCLRESGCDVVCFDKNKTLPRLHYKVPLGYIYGGAGGLGVAGQQPSSVRTRMSGRYILPFVFFCGMCFG